MANKIKCEWCGNIYDLDKHDTCPRCGGVNSSINTINENKKDTTIPSQNTIKRETEKKMNPVLKVILIIIGCIFLFNFIIFFAALALFGTNNKVEERYYDYGYDDLNYDYSKDDSLDNHNDNSDAWDAFGENYTYHTYYVENNGFVKTDDGGEFYIPFIYIDQYHTKSDYVSSSFPVNTFFQITKNDYANHSIELYLIKDGKEQRISSDSYSFSGATNVSSFDDLLKGKAEIKFYGKCNDMAENFDKITGLVVYVDDDKYEFSLDYYKEKPSKYIEDAVNYTISDKINFGENNLYIDNIKFNYYSYYKNDFSIGLKSVIKDNKNSELMFYVEDINGDIYPLFFNDLYSAKYSNYDDLLKLSAEQDNVYCVAYGKNIVPAKIHTFIDGEEYISNIK